MKCQMFGALLVLGVVSSSAAAAEPSPDWESEARQGLVDVESVWNQRTGVLVGDASTVWVVVDDDPGRDVEVSVPGIDAIPAQVSTAETIGGRLWRLSLAKPLPRRPLAVSTRTVEPGDVVYTMRPYLQRGLVKVLVASVTSDGFTLASEGDTVIGAPVLDAHGAVLGLLTSARRVARAEAIHAAAEAHRATLLPVFAMRFGLEIDGPMADVVGLLSLDGGVVIDDRLAVVFGFGLAMCDNEALIPLEGGAYGVVERGVAARFTTELRYRQYLGGGAFPFYLALAAGGVYSIEGREVVGPAFTPSDPSCDPRSDVCDVRLTNADIDDRDFFDVQVGADLHLGPWIVGYRFLPGLGADPMMHQIVIGTGRF